MLPAALACVVLPETAASSLLRRTQIASAVAVVPALAVVVVALGFDAEDPASGLVFAGADDELVPGSLCVACVWVLAAVMVTVASDLPDSPPPHPAMAVARRTPNA
jgi:hypothetical protein